MIQLLQTEADAKLKHKPAAKREQCQETKKVSEKNHGAISREPS